MDKLHFQWDEVHEIIEQLEHIKSEKLTNRLDEFLGFPKANPHTENLFPDRNGHFTKVSKVLLPDCSPGNKGTFIGMTDSSAAFLQYLDKQNISLGDEVQVLRKEEFDQSVEIDTKPFIISKKQQQSSFLT